MSFEKADSWTIVDISEEHMPSSLGEVLYTNSIYKDTSHEGEDLVAFSRVLELLGGSTEIELNDEETAFLNRLKEIMEENDSFYFRIITG